MLKSMRKGGYLLFEDGSAFRADRCPPDTSALGEGVFNTSHSGYQEILTDPSYSRQIMIFTTPHIGNVGINKADMESGRIHVAGIVVSSLTSSGSNWRKETDLPDWLKDNGTPFLVGADTRSITRHIRSHGAMRCGIFSEDIPVPRALELVQASPGMRGADLASEVSCSSMYEVSPGDVKDVWHPVAKNGTGLRVAILDFGVKRNILAELASRGCDLVVMPAKSGAERILKLNPDGVLLSNGPGDPEAVQYGIETARHLINKLPIFGICLGHQILALAAGARTYKLDFGHRAANHPVKRLKDNSIEITSQNHGFAVANEEFSEDWRISHINLNDQTVEGLEHIKLPVFSLQYHPESNPGPHDSIDYFDKFIQEMRNAKA